MSTCAVFPGALPEQRLDDCHIHHSVLLLANMQVAVRSNATNSFAGSYAKHHQYGIRPSTDHTSGLIRLTVASTRSHHINSINCFPITGVNSRPPTVMFAVRGDSTCRLVPRCRPSCHRGSSGSKVCAGRSRLYRSSRSWTLFGFHAWVIWNAVRPLVPFCALTLDGLSRRGTAATQFTPYVAIRLFYRSLAPVAP